MEWYWTLTIIFGAFVVLMGVGVPIAFAFLAINVVCCFIFWNGPAGLTQLALSISSSVTHYTIVSVPLFVLMGEVMFRSGIATKMMDVLDAWFGRLPGRLALMSVAGGTVFAALTGSGSAATAMLGKLLAPDMEKRGYHKAMTLGPIMGAGGLAIMIPPSALGVLLAALGQFSVGDFLVAIIVPGLLMSIAYAIYIVVRCSIQPHLAPAYAVVRVPLWLKLRNTAIYIFPLFTVMFLVVGLIFGIGDFAATPTEAAALGAVGTFVLAGLYGGLSLPMVKEALLSSMRITVMLLMIITGSTAFSQILAFTGATSGLAELATSANVPPIVVVIIMQLILIVMGMFMEPLSIMMLTVPIYYPVIQTFGYDPVWFGAIMLLNMEMATISPPFGLNLFVMRGVAPKGVSMGDVYAASIPFLLLDLVVMGFLLAFPPLVLWLPGFIAKQ